MFGSQDRTQGVVMTNLQIRLLMVEDSEDDARLLYSELTQTANDITYRRVETADGMRAALNDSDWDIVISDHSLPRFRVLSTS